VVLEEIPEGPELRHAWNELALGMERPEVFYTHEWAVAVQRAYGDIRKPLLMLGYEGDSLVGVVAFSREIERGAKVDFLAGTTGDYCDFLSQPNKRKEFVDAVLGELETRKIRKVVLTNLPANSFSVDALASAARKRRFNVHTRSAYMCARVILGSVEQREALKQTTTGKKRLRRNLRELEKKGPVFVRHDTDWFEIEPILQSFSNAHAARFLSTGRISNLIQPERRKFLLELARELSCSGWIAISRLLVGDIPVAWHYGFRFPGSWFWYQPTVDSGHEYGDFSPGYCLLAKIVELACDRPEVDVVDLGLGAEEYKERFATSTLETRYCVLSRSFSGHLQVAARDRVAEIAKSVPRIESGVRAIISSLDQWSARLHRAGVPGLLRKIARRARSVVFANDEVLFFQWTAARREGRNRRTTLLPLNSDQLGAAAIRYADEPTTIDFLMRSAQRFRLGQDRGFVLIDANGTPVHFGWVKDFEGFELAELERTLQAPSKDAVMIFDCYTPILQRGNGFFGDAIASLAEQLCAEGKAPWIFGAATNRSSLRGIEKSGFTEGFSLRRKRFLFFRLREDSIPAFVAKRTTSSPTLQ